MKKKSNKVVGARMLLGLTAITALCMASSVRAATTTRGKPSRGGGSGSGSGSGAAGNAFYATVTNFTQLVGDINYVDTVGGTFTIYLQPNTTFNLVTNYTCGAVGCNLLPIIGGTNVVNLTIIGNGSIIQRDATNGNSREIRLFEVAKGSSLRLDRVTLQNGYSYAFNGGAIYNSGTLALSNCVLTANTAHYSGYISTLLGGKGGAIYNNSGVVTIQNSIVSGNLATGAFAYGGAIYNEAGVVMISHSAISGNYAISGVDGDFAQLAQGGGLYNNGTVTVENSSSITGNAAGGLGPDVANLSVLFLDTTSTVGILDGNSALPLQ